MPKKQGSDSQLLTIHELAVYLHLDETTVGKLVTAGKIPSIQVERQWRFKKGVIDEWIQDQLVGDDESFADVPDGMKQPLEDLLPDQAIITSMRAKTPIGVIEELAARAYTNGWLIDKPWFVGAVVERESLASTAMEGGVAFLHTRAKDRGKIGRPFVVVGRSWEGIPFNAPDGGLTYLFFLLGLKYDKLHLPILGRLARALRIPATIAKLRALSSPDQLRALLLKEDAGIRAGIVPEVQDAAAFKPKLDRQLRLRAIRRLQTAKHTDSTPEPTKPKRRRGEQGAEQGAERKLAHLMRRKHGGRRALASAVRAHPSGLPRDARGGAQPCASAKLGVRRGETAWAS